MRLQIDACLVRQARHKGKGERRVGDARSRPGLEQRDFESDEDLQMYIYEWLVLAAANRRCPSTGRGRSIALWITMPP